MITRILISVGIAVLAMDIHSIAQDMRKAREALERMDACAARQGR